MLMCDKCFNRLSECECSDSHGWFDVDKSIFDIISVLNKKGYYTEYCCGGHVDIEQLRNKYQPNLYIKFKRESYRKLVEIPDFFEKEYTTCVLRYTVPLLKYIIFKPNVPKRYQDVGMLITDEVVRQCEEELQSKRGLIALWVNNLPIINFENYDKL